MAGSWLLGTRATLVDAKDRFHNRRKESKLESFVFSRPCSPNDILVHYLNEEEDWQHIDSAGVMTCEA